LRRGSLFTLSRLKAQTGFVLSPKALNVFIVKNVEEIFRFKETHNLVDLELKFSLNVGRHFLNFTSVEIAIKES